ncbi:protein Bzz1p [[Candida] jaroonii]|uniref:Protein Bzz1p n=1 Tax=[Candida] jaroonii TaxID=467808 RepID=A0ACA9Y8C0_9ASCO|nr:protein Bzz1p [[Candida] jaroonii]
MSLESLSIGNELKDSFKPTSKWINNGVEWLSDIDEFYKERATIEREYATKLKELTKKHFDKKAKNSTHLSVGDDPQITPGSLESASLVLWTDVLTQTELIADERNKLAHDFTTKIGDTLITLKSKTSSLAKRIEVIHDYLKDERNKIEDDVAKAKKHYDSLCSNTESARQKTEKSSSDKYQKRLEEKEVEMNIGKNDYLIKINIANRLKDKYYYQDIPELLDYYQELNESRVGILNKIIKNANIVERNCNDRIKERLTTIDKTIEENNPKLDTAMYIKHNLIDWKEPQDFYFIPSSIWHDDESLIVKEPELTDLKRQLNKSSIEYSKYEDSALNIKQDLEESVIERKKESDQTLKFDTKFARSLTLLSNFMKEDTHRVKNEVIIEVIQNFAGGKDLSYQEEAKVKKSRFGLFKNKKHDEDNGSDGQSLHTVTSSTSHKTIGSNGGLFNLRRHRAKSNASAPDPSGTTGKALYKYDATGDDETSVEVGDIFNVIDEDDGSGWTMINNNGKEGLVPTSYITIIPGSSPAPSDTPKKKGPSVAPKRGAKRIQYVEALYDYVADGDDEISISQGDKIILIQEDLDGSGWTEGEINGSKGLFPTSYVKKI